MKKFKVLFAVSVVVFSFGLIVGYLIFSGESEIINHHICEFGFLAVWCLLVAPLVMIFSLWGLSRSKVIKQENILHGKPITP